MAFKKNCLQKTLRHGLGNTSFVHTFLLNRIQKDSVSQLTEFSLLTRTTILVNHLKSNNKTIKIRRDKINYKTDYI